LIRIRFCVEFVWHHLAPFVIVFYSLCYLLNMKASYQQQSVG
jgi:hypothetical protein